MPRDPQALATMLEMAVKAANAPLVARIATLETELKALSRSESALLELRDRVTVMETKAAVVPPEPPPPVDVMPLVERIVALETFRETTGDLRDRVVAVETKAAHSVPQETKVVDFSPLTDRLGALEIKSAGTEATFATVADIAKDVSTLRERMAAVEARQPVPGPPGPAGRDGTDGKDGADGFSFEDLTVEQIDERTAVYKGTKGDRVKEFGRFTSHAMIHRGVWLEGKSYERGDVVTWAGSQWHANEDTETKPGEDAKWTLVVKRGRDGRDGKDAVSVPVVSVAHAGR